MELINLDDKAVEYLEDRIKGFHEKNENFSLGVIDIDFYEFIQEELGDEGLKKAMDEIGNALESLTRPMDLVQVLNTHQYLLGIREFTQDSMKVLMDRLRMSVDQFQTQVGDRELKLTISCGGTQLMEGDAIYSLISRALDQLRKSQDFGGNRVSIDSR